MSYGKFNNFVLQVVRGNHRESVLCFSSYWCQADAVKSGEGDLMDAMEPEEYVVEVEAGQSNQLHVWLSVHGFNADDFWILLLQDFHCAYRISH